jgi:hypothetical protein
MPFSLKTIRRRRKTKARGIQKEGRGEKEGRKWE